MTAAVTLPAADLAATDRIGRRLGAALRPRHVVALIGPLGSGKTTLVKSVAASAGVADPRQVNSPTFVIVNEYDAHSPAGPLRLYHVDAYRLRNAADLDALGFDEMADRGAVLVEWADRGAGLLPDDHLRIEIDTLGETARRFRCTAGGVNAQTLLDALAGESEDAP